MRACHDCSEGGIAVAAAEMALAGRLGVELDLRRIPHTPDAAHDTALAFSESLGRLIVAVRETDAAAFEAQMAGLHCAAAGRVRSDDRFILTGLAGTAAMDTRLDALETAWRGHLRLS